VGLASIDGLMRSAVVESTVVLAMSALLSTSTRLSTSR
jgi:hypothetical protein